MLMNIVNNQRAAHIKLTLLCFILLNLLIACSVINVQRGVSVSSSERWMVLPFQNNSMTPRAGEQIEAMLATLLRIQGVRNIEMYPQQNENKLEWPELSDRKRQEDALTSAVKNNVTYAISGNVDEWQYKLGVGSEPAVGLTIQIMEIPSRKIVWSASGARSGWSTESLSGTAQKLLRDLISKLAITEM